jgi:NADH-quinone oxidoreductase subunit E
MLSDSLRKKIESLFDDYATRQAVVLPALHLIQEALGHVPLKAVAELAELLGLAPAEVQDTLTFYGFFKQDRPVGVYRVWVCRSLSCSACNSEPLLDHLQNRLGIAPGETTPDGRVTLEAAECLGACDFAPAVLVNDKLHKNMTCEKLDVLLEEWV